MSDVEESKPVVVCVDDDVRLLEGLALNLRRRFEVRTANGPEAGLELLASLPNVSVVISDMRMPGMDGATMLSLIRQRWPEITRILLTGEPGRDVATSAVNKGEVFRFLMKPCSPPDLIASVEAAVKFHQTVVGEKAVLQETVLGAIRAMVDVLALSNPSAFGRTGRVVNRMQEISERLGQSLPWQHEAAAMLSQIGYVSLPSELVDKIYYGETLDGGEQAMASGARSISRQLVGRIPRLEQVAAIIAGAEDRKAAPSEDPLVLDGVIKMRIILDFDLLVTRGESPAVAVATLKSRYGAGAAGILDALGAQMGSVGSVVDVVEIRLRDIQPGMTLLDDVRTDGGTLLVPRGYEATEGFLSKMRNFGEGILAEKIRVRVPKSAAG